MTGVMSIHLVKQSLASVLLPSRNNWAAFLRYVSRRLKNGIARILIFFSECRSPLILVVMEKPDFLNNSTQADELSTIYLWKLL